MHGAVCSDRKLLGQACTAGLSAALDKCHQVSGIIFTWTNVLFIHRYSYRRYFWKPYTFFTWHINAWFMARAVQACKITVVLKRLFSESSCFQHSVLTNKLQTLWQRMLRWWLSHLFLRSTCSKRWEMIFKVWVRHLGSIAVLIVSGCAFNRGCRCASMLRVEELGSVCWFQCFVW